MKRLSRFALLGVLTAAVAIAPASAQLLNELLRGAANDVSSDIFGCGDGTAPCGLSYRMYSSVDSSEINGPANPVDGNPAYRAKAARYLSDTQTTANFPTGSGGGGGNEWYIVWDGITGAGTTDFVGWYGAQSQIVNFGEIGNSLSFNCLPVTSQEACYEALDEVTRFNDTTDKGGNAVVHNGGLSPIPCPQLTLNGLNEISYEWDQANNFVNTDFASNPLVGYDLYLLGNIIGTDADFGGGSSAVSSIGSIGTTSFSVPRTSLLTGSGLEDSTIYQASLKLRYAGGLESLFSCPSLRNGDLCTQERGDANSIVDLASLTADVRVEDLGGGDTRDLLFINLQNLDSDIVAPNIEYRLRFDADGDGQRELEIKVKFKKKALRRVTNPIDAASIKISGDGDVRDFLSGKVGVQLDDDRQVLSVVVDPAAMALALSPFTAQAVTTNIDGRTKIGGTKDEYGCDAPIFVGNSSGDAPMDDEEEEDEEDEEDEHDEHDDHH